MGGDWLKFMFHIAGLKMPTGMISRLAAQSYAVTFMTDYAGPRLATALDEFLRGEENDTHIKD